MTREPAEPLRLDYLIKAGTIHSMTGKTYRAVGLRGAEIVAVSAEPDGLDDLTGQSTAVVDAGAARDAAPGEWVLTSIGWHESNLAENRLQT